MSEYKLMNSVKPVCPKCGETGFEAIADDNIFRADKALALIVCQSESCRAVVGVVPTHEVFDLDKSSS